MHLNGTPPSRCRCDSLSHPARWGAGVSHPVNAEHRTLERTAMRWLGLAFRRLLRQEVGRTKRLVSAIILDRMRGHEESWLRRPAASTRLARTRKTLQYFISHSEFCTCTKGVTDLHESWFLVKQDHSQELSAVGDWGLSRVAPSVPDYRASLPPP